MREVIFHPQSVLYTEDMEPITILEIPEGLRNHLINHGVVRLPVLRNNLMCTQTNHQQIKFGVQ